MQFEVICLEEPAFYALIEKTVERLRSNKSEGYKWVSGEEAMQRLNITSKTTLQKFRDEGKIKFSQPEKRIILYDSDSINEFLEANSRETF